MLRLRQSSLIPVKFSVSVAAFGGNRVGAGFCTQTLPYLLPSRTPCHEAGACGCFQRSSPTGGAANGMFLNTVTPSTLPGAPWIRPCCVRTGSAVPTACAWAAEAPASIEQASRKLTVLVMGPLPCLYLVYCPPPAAAWARSAGEAVTKFRICTLPSWQAYS